MVLTGLKLWAQGTHGEWVCPASWRRPDCALLSPCRRCPVREMARVKVTTTQGLQQLHLSFRVEPRGQ